MARQQRPLPLSKGQPFKPQRLTRAPTFKPFEPYKVPPVPAGYYDPALDAAAGAAHRGYEDMQYDATLQGTRLGTDLQLGQEQIAQGAVRTGQDIDRQQSVLNRAYSQQGNRQRQQINAAGVGAGGASLQAAAKRAQNQAFDEVPLSTATTRAGEDAIEATKRLGLGYERQTQDIGIDLARAGREDTQFGVDTESEKAFSAAQAGYIPPGRPGNEHTTKDGQVFHVINKGGVRYRVKPDGTVLPFTPGQVGATAGGLAGQTTRPAALGASLGALAGIRPRRRRG